MQFDIARFVSNFAADNDITIDISSLPPEVLARIAEAADEPLAKSREQAEPGQEEHRLVCILQAAPLFMELIEFEFGKINSIFDFTLGRLICLRKLIAEYRTARLLEPAQGIEKRTQILDFLHNKCDCCH
jgi:hypothetical protein